MKIGVLALQGAFREHREALTSLDADVVEIRRPEHLDSVDAVVLPGGESTTVDKLLDSSGVREPLCEMLVSGTPALCTCAGLIVAASEVTDGRGDQRPLGVVDVGVRRNGYGRQRESFEAALDVEALGSTPFPGVFIRAPVICWTGPNVEVIATLGGDPVLGRDGDIWFATFHPELAGDLRIHQLFLAEVSRR